jgi:DNA-binding LacI/PurR family transcriptional regulator
MANQKEVAKLAGVAAGTVSNVISGSKGVSDKARRKVLEAIRKLNYRPNLIARSLKTNRTNTLGIIVPTITVSFFPKIIRGAESMARKHGYSLIVLESFGEEAREEELISLLEAQRVDGLLLVLATGTWRKKSDYSEHRPCFPIVCVDRVPTGLKVDSVGVDGRAAAEIAVAHLLHMGHRKIAAIVGPLSLPSERERLEGYQQALEKKGIKPKPSLFREINDGDSEVQQASLDLLLRSEDKPSALFTSNGVIALEALRGLYEAGMRTPEDFAFVTIDDIAPAEFFEPAITCVVQPAIEIGQLAAELLVERITKGDAQSKHRKILLPPKLVVRASSISKLAAN